MMSRRLIVTAFCLLAACERSESDRAPPNTEIDTPAPALTSSENPQLQELQKQIEEQKSQVEQLKGELSEEKEGLLALYKSSMSPYEGIWLMDPKPSLAFPDCEFMVRIDAEGGSIYRVAVCSDGKLQGEAQSVSGFAANNTAGWAGTLGFRIDGALEKNSCGENVSVFPDGNSYAFDHSMGTAAPSSEVALFMASPMGESIKNFKSGSGVPDLGKNKSCASIVTRAGLPSQAENKLLQAAAKVCQLTPELSGAGCFTANDAFAPGN